MNQEFTIEHITTYRYGRPVRFGEHRLFCRPRDGYDIRVLDTHIDVQPKGRVQWVHDVFSNWVAVFTPTSTSDCLRVEASVRLVHRGTAGIELPLDSHAERFPFDYSVDDRRDLGALLEPHYADPDGRLYEWTRRFFTGTARPFTRELLVHMTQAIHDEFEYDEREQEGTQPPDTTLQRASGSCRDYALLMMEALRRLGIAARFVSGYLYDAALDAGADADGPTDGDGSETRGAGATHAWLQAYLPGAGWVAFDPTNSIFGGSRLVRVAYARDPSQVPPLSGSYYGGPEDAGDMTVEVNVARRKASD